MKPYYEHAGITIYHGDSRAIAPALKGINAVVSDPPYGMKDKSDRSTTFSRCAMPHAGMQQPRKWDCIVGDDEDFDPSLWTAYPKCVLFGAVHFSPRLPKSRCWLVWDKREGGTPDDNADCDFAWTNLPGPARMFSQLWRGMVRRGVENAVPIVHPHQKPLDLMQWVITRCGLSAGDLILDPYMGSGTTLVAAKNLGFTAIGIDIEERHCEIAAKRLSQEVMNFEEGAA